MDSQQQEYKPVFAQETLKELDETYTHQQLIRALKDPEFNYGLGSVMGACMADALGSFCEFSSALKDSHMDEVMEMNGGGTFQTKPGQYTDDSELAAHLMDAVNFYSPKQPIEQQTDHIILRAALGYEAWYNSSPFDMGNTCRGAFRTIKKTKLDIMEKDKEVLREKLNDMLTEIATINSSSQSNGSLMRIAPMGFFVAIIHEDFANCESLIRKEIGLTHSDIHPTEAGFVWVRMLSQLIKRKQKLSSLKEIHEIAVVKQMSLNEWVLDSKVKDMTPATKNMGWVRIAWSMGINRLKLFSGFENEKELNTDLYRKHIRLVIQKGGDTDTNGAIVGGMIGAVIGFKELPREYLSKMMALKFPKQKKTYMDRSPFYQPRYMVLQALRLYRKIRKV